MNIVLPYPNYDVSALARTITAAPGWQLVQTRFYTGIPDPTLDPPWHRFWSRKLAVMGRMALDVVRMTHRGECDVALILSQDQDLSEVAEEIRSIARSDYRRSVPPGVGGVRYSTRARRTSCVPSD